MQWNYRQLVNKTMQSVCQICQKEIHLQKVSISPHNMQTIFRIRLPNAYTVHENKVSEEHEAGQDGVRNMTLEKNPKLIRNKEA